ncbi:unnamed protein product [Cercospora beticola]|nr:unnamed protein product [Cercospora beticola]
MQWFWILHRSDSPMLLGVLQRFSTSKFLSSNSSLDSNMMSTAIRPASCARCEMQNDAGQQCFMDSDCLVLGSQVHLVIHTLYLRSSQSSARCFERARWRGERVIAPGG